MTEKQRYYCKIIFIVFIVLRLFCLNIKPVTQDSSAITPTLQLALQGQDSNLQPEEQSVETLGDSHEEQKSPEEPNKTDGTPQTVSSHLLWKIILELPPIMDDAIYYQSCPSSR